MGASPDVAVSQGLLLAQGLATGPAPLLPSSHGQQLPRGLVGPCGVGAGGAPRQPWMDGGRGGGRSLGGPRRWFPRAHVADGRLHLPPSQRPQDHSPRARTGHPSIRAALSPKKRDAANATMSLQRNSQGSARQDFKWSLSPEAAEATAAVGRGGAGPGGKTPTSRPASAGGGGWDTPLTKKGKGLSPFPSLHSLGLRKICMGGRAFLPPPVACLGQRALRR